jgi:sigma-B regulation protein RsbU (phosphoserine phosphatase)
MFVTIFCGILNTSTGEVFYSNGGHNHPYILSKDHGTKPLNNKSGMALGVFEAARYSTSTLTLAPGDRIFLYTDGVTEAMDVNANFYTDEGLIRSLENQKDLSIEDGLRAILNDLKNFSSGAPQADDITLMAIKYQNR